MVTRKLQKNMISSKSTILENRKLTTSKHTFISQFVSLFLNTLRIHLAQIVFCIPVRNFLSNGPTCCGFYSGNPKPLKYFIHAWIENPLQILSVLFSVLWVVKELPNEWMDWLDVVTLRFFPKLMKFLCKFLFQILYKCIIVHSYHPLNISFM